MDFLLCKEAFTNKRVALNKKYIVAVYETSIYDYNSDEVGTPCIGIDMSYGYRFSIDPKSINLDELE